jgi:hypothetical protein
MDKTISDHVKKSWTVPEVRAARMKKEPVWVTVSGVSVEVSSLYKAFCLFNFPPEKHQGFRVGLKASRREALIGKDGREYLFEYRT